MLDMDGLPFMVNDPAQSKTPEEQLRETEAWLLRASYIELIAGLNESLMEACRILRILKMRSLVGQKAWKDQAAVDAHLDEIDGRLMGMAIPTLMSELKTELVHPLPLFDSVLSINKVRNCLIHGNSEVRRRDTNDPDHRLVRLTYIHQEVLVRSNGIEHRVDRQLKAQATWIEGLRTEHLDASIDFPLGTRIELTTDLVNNVAYTCYLFLQRLRLAVFEKLGVQPNQVVPEVNLK